MRRKSPKDDWVLTAALRVHNSKYLKNHQVISFGEFKICLGSFVSIYTKKQYLQTYFDSFYNHS